MLFLTHRSFLVPPDLEDRLEPANYTVGQLIVMCMDQNESRVRGGNPDTNVLARIDVSFLEALSALARLVPVSPDVAILFPDPTIEPDGVFSSAVALSPVQKLDLDDVRKKVLDGIPGLNRLPQRPEHRTSGNLEPGDGGVDVFEE